jgi:hypothetical protein
MFAPRHWHSSGFDNDRLSNCRAVFAASMVRDDKSRIRPNRRPAMRLSKNPVKKRPAVRSAPIHERNRGRRCGSQGSSCRVSGTEPEQRSHNSFTEHRSKTDCA